VPRIVEEPPPSRPAYFWWTLANALALCFALVSWGTCLLVFRHPEDARNFEILRKLKRLPELKAYKSTDAPAANSLLPKELYAKYFGFNDKRIARINPALMRNYLMNFERAMLLNYVEGSYSVENVRPLKDDDFLSPGFVVRGRALVKPDENSPAAPYPVVVDYIFPTTDRAAFSWFKPGDTLSISKAQNCAAVLHVAKIKDHDEDVLCVTAVPIIYSTYMVGDNHSFEIELPSSDQLKPGAKFPMFK